MRFAPESERAGKHVEDVQEDHRVLFGLVFSSVAVRKLHVVGDVSLPTLGYT